MKLSPKLPVMKFDPNELAPVSLWLRIRAVWAVLLGRPVLFRVWIRDAQIVCPPRIKVDAIGCVFEGGVECLSPAEAMRVRTK